MAPVDDPSAPPEPMEAYAARLRDLQAQVTRLLAAVEAQRAPAPPRTPGVASLEFARPVTLPQDGVEAAAPSRNGTSVPEPPEPPHRRPPAPGPSAPPARGFPAGAVYALAGMNILCWTVVAILLALD